jgi:flagellar basal-body rod protein FlgG
MLKGIFATLNGKSASARRLDIISNNLANALTPGFKATRAVFNVSDAPEPEVDPGLANPTYVNMSDTYIHFSDAPITQTGNPFDLAIEGPGFFAISTPQGTMYTRNGQFSLNSDKQLVTQDGRPVMGDSGGEIILDGKDINIEIDGTIYVDRIRVDRIKVVDFENKKDLRNFGASMFVNTNKDANPELPVDAPSVKQGAYEGSNVEVMKELVDMISTMRAYETYTKVDQAFNDLMGKLLQLGKG